MVEFHFCISNTDRLELVSFILEQIFYELSKALRSSSGLPCNFYIKLPSIEIKIEVYIQIKRLGVRNRHAQNKFF